MPAASRVGRRATAASVLALAITKSGSTASRTSKLGSLMAPRRSTVSGRPRSNWVQVSSAAATMVSFPPAKHHTSAKLPVRMATRSGRAMMVTSRSRSSVVVKLSMSSLKNPESFIASAFGPGLGVAVAWGAGVGSGVGEGAGALPQAES